MSSKEENISNRQRLRILQRQLRLKERQRSLAQTDQLSAGEVSAQKVQDVAVIGIHGFLPSAMEIDDFWNYLDDDTTVIEEIPMSRFDWREFYDETGRDVTKMHTKWGGYIPDVKSFDPGFFGILPDEADVIDPQQRLLLMSVYKTIQDAGYAPLTLRKKNVGIYIGIEDNEYLQHLKENHSGYGINGFNHHPSMAANRLSYFFDTRGPSEIVNTMCSSSAVAIHRACNAIKNGEIESAIVGGARIIIRPEPLIGLSGMKVVTSQDNVKSFGTEADGYIRSEGVASIMLKSLAEARKDNDHIYAVIKGSAINYNGQGGMSIAAPNRDSHTQVIKACYTNAKVDPRRIEYIEAQGMGNQVGDITEWESCNDALQQLCDESGQEFRPGYCRVSTLKPMLGHMECVSALGALFKVIRSFQTNKIHKIIGLSTINPYLNLDGRPCRLLNETEEWRAAGQPRLAGIHSYGSGGNNAHLLIEEYRQDKPALSAGQNRFLLPVSAKTRKQAFATLAKLREFVAGHDDLNILNMAYTLQTGRDHFKYRIAIIADSPEDFLSKATKLAVNAASGPDVFLFDDSGVKPASSLPRIPEDDNLAQFAAAWVAGQDINWPDFYNGKAIQKISLPGYVFDNMSCWVEKAVAGNSRSETTQPHNEKNEALPMLSAPTSGGKRICVIGAGPSGLVMAKSLLEEGHVPVVYEKQSELGGLWVLNQHKTAGAYKKTRFQSSKFTSIFSDFYLKEIKSNFYSVNEVKAYLEKYAENFALNQYIHYNSEVNSVEQKDGRWRVTVIRDGQQFSEDYDGVAMCQGSFWQPFVPHKEGMDSFKGTVIHSGQYYDNSIFEGKRVLVIGNGISGMDIAEEASLVAKNVIWSRRSKTLILPRMVGFVPNDCQSPASLLIPSNRTNIMDRLKVSMPEYFEMYRQSGILPSHEDFERNPIVHINDNIVRLISEQKVGVKGAVKNFTADGCVFEAGEDYQDIDVVVFCTGYQNFGKNDLRYKYLRDISLENDFSMGIFYHRNPSLVNTSVLPVAFTGFFYFSEMIARWYAQILSGNYRLSREELDARITKDYYHILAPISSVMFGLKLGLFPNPETEFREFWRLLNYPAFPMIYRLRGPHKDPLAAENLDLFKKTSFVRTDESNSELKALKYRILAGLGRKNLDYLLSHAEIRDDEYQAALTTENPLVLNWESQFVKRETTPATQAMIEPTPVNAQSTVTPGMSEIQFADELGDIMAAILRIDSADIQPDGNLSEYGFDSITLAGFAREIVNKYDFMQLDPSVFLDHPSLRALTEYLYKKYFIGVRYAGQAPDQIVDSKVSARQDFTEQLKSIMAEILRIEVGEVQVNKNLSDYGFDSITLSGFARTIAEKFDYISMQPSTFLEHPNLASLAEYLFNKYQHNLIAAATQPPLSVDEQSYNHELAVDNKGENEQEAIAPNHTVDEPGCESDDIAIIGIGGKYPGAQTLVEFWNNLVAEKSSITEIPQTRWDWKAYYGDPQREPNKTDCYHGAFIETIDEFDPLHFDISPREAVFMDPQHRMIMEVVWQTMENAGYSKSALHNRPVALYVGVEKRDYAELLKESDHELDGYMNTGNAHSMLANRVSHYFSWTGPSMVLDTACSGSFTALNSAVETIRSGKAEIAFVGGVNVLLTPSLFVLNRKLGMLTSESRIKPFDKNADGHLNGEGVGMVLLKRLSQAERDNDYIYGVIKAVSVQHGGKGLYHMAPNPVSHQNVIRDAIEKSGIDKDDVDYIEAQGAGNPLTDIMELKTYQQVFSGREQRPLLIGTIKSNIGHVGAASGVTALIKAVLSVKNNTLTKVLNLDTPNWDSADGEPVFRLVTETESWPKKSNAEHGVPRRIGIHNYGYGGMNAHAIFEEYLTPDRKQSVDDGNSVVIVLSTRVAEQLPLLVESLYRYLQAEQYKVYGLEQPKLKDIAYTLQTGREHFQYRLAIVVRTQEELLQKLATFLAQENVLQLSGQGIYATNSHSGAEIHYGPQSGDHGASQTAVQKAATEQNARRLAFFWINGARVDWSQLHTDKTYRHVPLVDYPFLREKYWITQSQRKTDQLPQRHKTPSVPEIKTIKGDMDGVVRELTGIIAEITGIESGRIKPGDILVRLGFNSLLMMQMADLMEKSLSVHLSQSDLIAIETVSDLTKLVEQKQVTESGRRAGKRVIPELEILQGQGSGVGAFWFHGALGTINPYIPLANKIGSKHPFYAFQSKGIRGEDKPLDSVRDMAKYYAEILLSVAPQGPYVLGGYSQGGVLAYEVARELQLTGNRVNKLILLDTPYPPVKVMLSKRYRYAISFINILQLHGISDVIDIKSINFRGVKSAGYIDYLVDLGIEKGITYKQKEFRALLERFITVSEANIRSMRKHIVTPLPKPLELQAVYFSRSEMSRFFSGAMLNIKEIERQNEFYRQNYCLEKWKKLLPDMKVVTTDAADHFSMLEGNSLNAVVAECKKILTGVNRDAKDSEPTAAVLEGRV